MAILVNSGRAAMAAALMSQPFFLAWGSGGGEDWDALDTPPSPSVLATELLSETGRHLLTSANFCTQDDDGEIVVPTGRYSVSQVQTNHIYLRFNFDFEDGAGLEIREIGVFSGGSVNVGLPPGQLYFDPDEVHTLGTLVLLENVPVFTRSANVRQSFELVLTI